MKKSLQFFTVLILAATMNTSAQKNKYPFAVNISGNGKQSIIFIPGFACSGKVWDSTVINYQNKYKCYVLTMAGFAGVPAQPDPSFINWEKAIAAYIKDNKINKPVIVGHSMGGVMAMALAADYSDVISKIVVVDALPCLSALNDTAFKSKAENDYSMMVNQMKAMTDSQFYQMQKFSMPRLLADTMMLSSVIDWSIKSDRTTLHLCIAIFQILISGKKLL